MKKIFIMIMLILITLQSNECTHLFKKNDVISTNIEKNGNLITDINVGWHFEISLKLDQNGTEVPYTKISLLINDEKIEIGEFLGYPEEITDFKNSAISDKSIMACKTWFGGAGTDTYVEFKGDNTLVVMYRYVDESNDSIQNFTILKEIKFETKIRIKTLKAKTINS
jgi:hypothetical protein